MVCHYILECICVVVNYLCNICFIFCFCIDNYASNAVSFIRCDCKYRIITFVNSCFSFWTYCAIFSSTRCDNVCRDFFKCYINAVVCHYVLECICVVDNCLCNVCFFINDYARNTVAFTRRDCICMVLALVDFKFSFRAYRTVVSCR